MAESKEDIKHATAQAKQSEDESLRVAYKHGKIAESSPVDLFSSAQRIHDSSPDPPQQSHQSHTATNANTNQSHTATNANTNQSHTATNANTTSSA
ncbi:hypothetical protein HRI_002068300 [Hibiscus trionum]|uniref:Seed maturation protein n=1 Tax=Hibiscus trionum TaxID=183268 RepID=A0A9W7M2Y0_HIBTR|nr:hypothetical protein HRI_002068300 [Hibiscus trionum]